MGECTLPCAQVPSPRAELTDGASIQETTSLLHNHAGDDVDIGKNRTMSADLSLDGSSGQLGDDKSGSLQSQNSSNADSIQLSVIGPTGV